LPDRIGHSTPGPRAKLAEGRPLTAREHASGTATAGWAGIGFGFALAVFAAFEQFKLPPVLPVMLARYGYDRLVGGGLMSAYAIAGLVLSLPVGRALARRDPGRFVATALALFMIGQALALVFPASGAAMLTSRAIEGAGFTILAIAGPLIAAGAADARHLPLVVGLTTTWIPTGQVLANLAALPAVARGAWTPLWWVGLALTGLLAGLALARRRRQGARDRTRRDARRPPAHAETHGAIKPAPRSVVVVAAAVFALWSGQYFAYMTWLPQYLVEAHGLGAENAALAYTLPVSIVGLLCLATGVALRAGAPFAPLFWGSIAVQAGVWFLVPAADGAAAGLASLVVYGLTAGITPVCLFTLPWIMAGAEARAGGLLGALMTGRNLGVLLGPVLLAAIAPAGDWSAVWPLFGALTAIAGGGAFFIGRRLRATGALRRASGRGPASTRSREFTR